MTEFLPKEVLEGLNAARRAEARRKSRIRIHVGEDIHRVLRLWDDGFALEAEDAPQLRGLVDLYDGGRHLYQCLIVASAKDGGEMHYEFKRSTAAVDRAPLDFARDEEAPAALLMPPDAL